MAFAGTYPTLLIDLNMLRGDRIRARRDFTESVDDVIPPLAEGDLVRTVEEEGDVYMAVVERVEGMTVSLRLLLETWEPAVEL